MSTWIPVAPGKRGLAAWAKLNESSKPLPLTGSVAMEPGVWLLRKAPDAVLAAYGAADAPLPAGSKITPVSNGLVVTAPHSTSAIFVRKAGGNSLYRILSEPNIVVTGSVKAEVFARVGVSMMPGTAVPALVCQFEVAGVIWSLDLFSDLFPKNDDDDENSQDPDTDPDHTVRTAFFGPGKLDDVLSRKPARLPAAVTMTEGSGIQISVTMPKGAANIHVVPTESLIQFMSSVAPLAYAATYHVGTGAAVADKAKAKKKPVKKPAPKKAPAKKKP